KLFATIMAVKILFASRFYAIFVYFATAAVRVNRLLLERNTFNKSIYSWRLFIAAYILKHYRMFIINVLKTMNNPY
ncbi:MAG TPA: hypothetical protein PKD70_10700, partial [Saprospiraceae bacterium]|nr:hypothetical protein [Saprospiraceae bacterium]